MAHPRIPSPIGKWTALKLEHLDHYLQAYVRATQKARETHYIDCFAGCGDCFISESRHSVQGSPWRALNAIPPFSQYHFVEKKPALAAHLRSRIAASGFTNASVYSGDCNQVIPTDILPRVPRNVPCFAFLDPYGLQLRWETIVTLASHRRPFKMELLILYPYDMAVARLFSLAKANIAISRGLTSFYGDESWRTELEQSMRAQERTEERRARFVRLYTGKLGLLGYRFVETFGPLYSKRRPLYHVIFASDHSVGAKIMREVWARTRFVPGELGYTAVRRPGQPSTGL